MMTPKGECGAPAEWEHGGAMEPFNWTETEQLKWDLRAMLGDAARPLVNFSSVFTIIDVCYEPEPNNVGKSGGALVALMESWTIGIFYASACPQMSNHTYISAPITHTHTHTHTHLPR